MILDNRIFRLGDGRKETGPNIARIDILTQGKFCWRGECIFSQTRSSAEGNWNFSIA